MEFLSMKQLVEYLPWQASSVRRMVKQGIFRPIRNPLATQKGEMFFLKSHVTEVIMDLMNNPSKVEQAAEQIKSRQQQSS